jgi:hypothetical protein
LARALKAKGVQLFSYRSYLAVARSGRIKPKQALRRDAIRKLAGPLGLSGVVTSAVQRSGRRYLFTFRLYDSEGKLRIKRVFRSKRPRLSSRQIWRMARQMANKLGAGASPLVGQRLHSRSLTLEEPPTVTDGLDQNGLAQGSKPGSKLASEVDLVSFYTSNLFMDRSEQYDFALKPSIDIVYDFSANWAVGYSGELNTYIRHEALLSHWHQLNLLANPVWGENGQNEFFSEFSLGTLRNQDQHEELNHLQPSWQLRLSMQPAEWFRWQLEASFVGRWFYDDESSNSIDAWAGGSFTLTLPSRTTISPRASYGYRHYLKQIESLTEDDFDQQVEFGIHISQGLWKRAGLQFDYAYLWAIDDSRQVQRMFTQAQSTYLGGDFLWSGHRAEVGFKHLLGGRADIGFKIALNERAYAGWPALDAESKSKGVTRHDYVLVPKVFFNYVWRKETADQDPLVPDIGIQIEYTLTRQWSNSDLHDTHVQMLALSMWSSW